MAAIRIRGTWNLTMSQYEGQAQLTPASLGDAVLEVRKATRAGLEGQFTIGRKEVQVKGRVKPGSPAVVTLHEIDENGGPVSSGLEAMLFIPPWWPNIDYNYDFITGTLVIGPESKAVTNSVKGVLISVSGVQQFE